MEELVPITLKLKLAFEGLAKAVTLAVVTLRRIQLCQSLSTRLPHYIAHFIAYHWPERYLPQYRILDE